jgi:serine/threonine protein kinase
VGDLLDKLVEYRNKTSGHGAPAAHTPEMLRGLGDALLLAASELFTRLDVLAGRRLMYVAEVRPVRGSWLVERVELAGVAPWRVASLEVARAEGQPPPVETGVCLADPAAPDDLAALTRLHPFVAYEPESESVLFLNARRGGPRVELLCYTSGRTVNVSNAGDATQGDGDDSPAEPPSAIGRCIGEYKLLTELGRGAMGIVYRAWQPSLNREVAIKVQPRTGDAKADARFRREVRALGRVEHPNLIKVHTSGSDGDYFYYTMELVEGAPLAAVSDALTHDGRTTIVDLPAFQEKVGAACAAAKAAEKPLSALDKADPFKRDLGAKSKDLVSLPELLIDARQRGGNARTTGRDFVRQIVTLLRQVAEAANALHEAGILHRDVKPGNVLVTADSSTAVLMDLGLAQLADDIEGRLTRTRQFVGTLRYASPQQVLAAGSLDRRADVYSLGATLWELLALRPLFGATESMPTMALMEMIQRDDPERLGRINHSVDRDLEAVVHKCLEKSPDRRYATAQDLAADLGRWLDGKPVTARPVRGWERAWKWSKRRPVLSGLSAALVLAVAAGTAASWVFAAKAERAADRARAERDVATEQKRRTRQALDMMVSEDMIERLGSQKELTKNQRQFLQRALDYYRDFAAEAATDEEGRKLEAEANFRIGFLLQSLGQKQESVSAYRRALPIYESLTVDAPADPEFRRKLAACHTNLGDVLAGLGQSTAAAAEFRASQMLLKALAAEFPSTPSYRHDLAAAHRSLGKLLAMLSQQSAAAAEYRAGLEVIDALVAEYPAQPEYRSELAAGHRMLGALLSSGGQRSAAEVEYRAALAILKKLAAEFSTVANYRHELVTCQDHFGGLLQALGRPAEAEAEYRSALAAGDMLVGDFPAVPDYRTNMAWLHDHFGSLQRSLGRWSDAEVEYRASLGLRERLVAEFPGVPDYRRDLADNHNNLGVLMSQTRRAAAAEPEYRAALEVSRKLVADFPDLPENRRALARAHTNLGGTLFELARPGPAVDEFRAAQAIQSKLAVDFPTMPDYREELGTSHNNLGYLFAGIGRQAEAEAEYHAAITIREKLAADAPAVPAYQFQLGGTWVNLGNLRYARDDFAGALEWHVKAVDRLAAVVRAEPGLAVAKEFLKNAYIGRAQDFMTLNRYPEALSDWDAALKCDDGSMRVSMRFRRADCLARLGRVAESVHENEELLADPTAGVGTLYDCACAASLASAVPDKVASPIQAALAVQLLRKAIGKGFADIPHLIVDTDLDSLRKRADFAALLWDVADVPAAAPKN